jgi:uncharacterized repeat protein (TIGR01451 family)
MKINMKKINNIAKLFSVITIAIMFFSVGTSNVLAATFNNNPLDYETLRVGNFTKNPGSDSSTWTTSVSADANDTVNFAIYYHNTATDVATNVRVRLTPQTTGVGTSQSFTAYVWADNAPQVSSPVTVNLSSNQSISFNGSVVWRPNQTTWGSQALPNSQTGSEIFSTNGLLLGNIGTGWSAQGNVIIAFKVSGTTSGSAPTATTNTATNVTQSSATLGCFVNPNGGANTTRWFEYGPTQSFGSQTAVVSHGTTASNITENISGLTSNSIYYFRCNAQNANGTTNGNIVSFYTSGATNQLPTVTTYTANNTGSSFAVLNGYVNPNGNTNVTRWFEYSTNSWSFTNSTVKLGQGVNASNFSETISGLTPGTTYYYRAVAQTSTSGQVYGSTQSFYTRGSNTGQSPFVTTNTATNVTQSSATLNGYVNPYNNTNTTRWFEYGTTQSLGYSTSAINHGSTATNINDTISGLLNNTTYYYRAASQSLSGGSYRSSYGSILSFTTGNNNVGSAPIAITNLATNIDQDSARLNGLALVSGNAVTRGWFEWGRTVSLGNTTSTRTLGSVSSMSSYASMFGLLSNTTYYYRFVVQNQNGVSRGNILNFRTNSVNVRPPVNPPERPAKVRNVSIVKTIENINSSNGTNVKIDALRGEKVRFTITIENTGNYTLENVVIKDRIPFYLEFANADKINTNNPQREVVWNVGSMAVGEKQSVILDVIVTGNARVGDIINNIARVESKRLTKNSNVVSINVVDKVSSLTASSFFGGISFFPNTLVGWLLIVILIFALVLLSRKLYSTNKENGEDK